MPFTAYLSLGSNLGERRANLQRALRELAALGEVVAVSPRYDTEPVELAEQSRFLNCAVALRTSLSPRQLVDGLLAIERSMGRQRSVPKGPRNIDLDIILFADLVVSEPGLTIPHPAMHQRRFVLEPLAEIAPHVVHPVMKKTVAELLTALPPGQNTRRVE
jgi:2-amino-4-hydroxy-6-hydroxymethyldihydropteridine diphosphokinase